MPVNRLPFGQGASSQYLRSVLSGTILGPRKLPLTGWFLAMQFKGNLFDRLPPRVREQPSAGSIHLGA